MYLYTGIKTIKNAIVTNDTIKLFEEPLSKSKNGYSTKNKILFDSLNKALKLKLGESFLIDLVHGKTKVKSAIEDNIEFNTSSDILKSGEISNLFDNFSLCFTDRIFRLAINDKGQFLIYCLPIKNQFKEIFVKDKNSVLKENVNVRNPITNETHQEEITIGKGKRPLAVEDVAKIETAFNLMLGQKFNKPLCEVVKKEKISA